MLSRYLCMMFIVTAVLLFTVLASFAETGKISIKGPDGVAREVEFEFTLLAIGGALYETGDGNKETISVSYYGGIPILLDNDIRTEMQIEMNKEKKIEIISAEGPILYTTKESTVPIITEPGKLLGKTCAMCCNVTWVFKKNGMIFKTKMATYQVKKSDATIRYTKGGVLMDGVQMVTE